MPVKLIRQIKMFLSETCSKVHIGKYLCVAFHVQNGLKQGNTLSALPFSVALELAVRKDQENKETLELNRTRQFLVYADIHLLSKN
jgi:hypothetical protein